MKKLVSGLVILTFIFVGTDLNGQYYKHRNDDRRHKNIRVEFFGNHLFGGINYDMRFLPGRLDGFGASIGTGFLYLSANRISNGNNSIYIQDFPLEINYLAGKNSHSFVAGAGIIPMYLRLNYDLNVDVKILWWEFNELKDNPKYFGIPAGFARLGYRYQPEENGFMCEFSLVPIIVKGVFIPSFGFSFGYGFK